ncbi:ESPR-type extended signal peptide-containing protein [Acinetobacter junii]|uniref:ESPR-type extended signal peptide-containing protein n=2 Tax=Acinetobacter junii TaxID=40215 RepID=UPI001FB52428|nr:ESPR-type extended signal peptide-containing protein [Acinetobacter junii]UOB53954.1 YadA-like family protein [Acinetobacter junii]
MNKVYKVVWNASLGIWVAVSELAKGKTKSSLKKDLANEINNGDIHSVSQDIFFLKPLSFAIISIFTSFVAYAEVGVGGGASSSNTSTAISPTNIQCGSLGQATITGTTSTYSTAIGCGTTITNAPDSVAIGKQNTINATNSTNQQIADRRGGATPVNYPTGQTGYTSASVALGTLNSTGAGGGVAIGNGNQVEGEFHGVAIGQGNRTTNGYAVGLGVGNLASGTSSVSVGTANQATGNTAIAVGRQSYAKGDNSIAVGNIATSDGKSSIAIGDASLSTTVDSISLGRNAKSGFGGSTDVNAIAIGADSTSYAYGVALGNGATADQSGFTSTNGGIAIGSAANTEAGTLAGIALGNSAKVSGSAVNSVAIGKDANASVNNSVALGAGSTTTAQSGNSFLTNVAPSATNGVVSVGTSGATRRIQNVADGAALTDAVNVAQLDKAYDDAHSRLATALGGGATYDPVTNAYTAPTYNVTTDPNAGTKTGNVNNVGAALSGLDTAVNKAITFNANTGSSTNKLGSTLNITGGLVGTGSNANVKTIITGNTVDIQIADAPTFAGTVTAGNLATGGTLSVTGVSNLNGGANLNNQKITNLAAGTASGDAVNFSQLTTTNNNVTTAQNTANTALTNANNAQTSANAAQSTANTALTEAQKGLNFRANAGATDKVSLGETITLADGTNTTVTYDAATNTYKYNVVDAPTFVGTVTAGNLATSGTLSVTGVSNLNGGANLNNQKITNLAAGTAPGDAVNFSQLTTTNNNVTTAQNTANTAQTTANTALTEAQKGLNFSVNGGAGDNVKLGETVNFANGTNTTATYDAATNTYKYNVVDAPTFAGTVTAGNLATGGTLSVTGVSNLNGGANLNNQKITNLAAGTAPGDAVNFSQLTTTNNNVTTAQNTANTALTNANNAQTSANAAQSTANTALTEAQKGINFGDGSTSNNYALGETINVKGDSNVNSVTTADGVQLSLASDIVLDSVTTGNSKLDNSGLTITGGPSITTAGIDAANTNISNVADATTADQAVNKGQLDAATAAADDKTDALGNSTASNLGGGATYNSTTGAVTAPTYTVNGTDVNNVGAAISELDKGWNLASNGANAGAIKAGDTVDIGTAAGETNLQVAKSGNTIQYSLSRDLDLDSVTTGNSKLDNSGLTITGGPSITTAGIDAANTNISNVADATTADQAVNKGQLDAATAAADDKTDALGNSTASNLGGGATYNSTTGAVTAPTYTVNGTDVNNVGAAISELDKGWNLASNGANAGAIKAGDTVDIGTAAGETNLQVAKSGNTIQYSLSRDLDLDSVTTGNSKLDNSGLTITGGPSITTAGIDAANTNISNVADATTADQAVNKGQLDAATAAADDKTDALGNSTASNLGGGATYNSTTGAVTAPTYTVNGTDVNNVGAAISELDKGWNLASNGANAGAIKAGDTVDIGTAAGETNLQVAKSGNTIQYSLSRDLDLDSVTTGNSKLDNSGLTITGGPSITTAGIDAANTNISNVADATTADQAVNKGQLDAATAAADDKTDALGNSTASNLGGGATYNSTTGAVTAPTYTVNGTDVNNVGAAISELDKGWNLASNGANAGAIKAGDTVDIGTAAGETNLQVAKSGNTIQYSLSRDLDLDSVTTGNSKLDNSGLTITGGPSITTAGIDAANTNISNVADATTADQAVNKGQLDAATAAADDKTDALGNSTASNLGGGATYNSTTGAVTAPTYTVNGTDVNNVGAAISELDKGWNLASNGANAGAIKAGDTVDIGTAAGETNLQVAKSGNTIQYSLSRDLDLDSVTTGNSKLDNSGLTITGGPSITTAGIDAANTNISNVADATTADQAVNKGQLDAATAAADDKTDALGNSTASNLGGGATYNSTTGAVTAPTYTVNGTDVNNVGAAISELDKGWNLASNGANAGAIKAGDTVDIGTAAGETNLQVAKSGNTIQYSLSRDLDLDSVTTGNSKLDNSGLTITGGPSITTAGIDAANTNISNVADATTADQAVNKGQLDAATAAADDKTDALGNSTASNLGGGATYNSTTGAVTAPTYTVNGTDVNNVGAAISELDKGWNLASNGANAGAIKAGDTVDIGTAAGETNLQVAKSGNTIQYSLSRDLDLDSVTTGNSKLDNSGLTITGGPSITTAGIDAANTNISNVADATTADQAVNKGQLDAATAAADDKTDALGNSTASNLGGGATYNSTTGAVTAPTYTVNGTDVNNVGAAISELDKGWNLASNGANAGAIKAGDTVDIGTAAGETNLQVAKSGNTIQYSLSRDLDLDSVTTGNSKLDNSGLTITGGPSITTAGIDAANTNISNVADATTADQAVNKGQLDAATAAADDKTDALGNSTASNLGGGATYNSTTGAVTAPTYTVNGTDVNNVGAAISELDKGWNLASNGANAGAIKAGDTVDIGTAAGETNLQVAKSGNTIQYSLSRDLDLDSVTTGNSKLDNSGLTITGGPSITTAGIDAANTNISNVADATTADQAVNKGQLDAATAAADDKTDALGNSTASNLGGGATYNSTTGAVTAPTYTVNGTDVNNVGAAISELDKGWNLASNGANAGAIKAGDTVDIGTAAGETNLQVAKSGNTIQYSLSRDLDLDSVTTGNSKLDNSGLTITGGPSITTAGIDAANTNISNVADATTADQAVNKGQLDAATAAADDKTDALGNSTASNLGGGATYNSTTGAVTAPTYTVNGTDVNNVGAAISELDKGWNLASNGANAGAIKAGDTVDIGTAAGETNLQVAKSGNTIQYSLSRDLDLDSVTTGNSKLDNSGLTITGGPSITTAGIDAANTNISNVADATTADQAVNKGQLDAATAAADDKTDALGNSTASNLGGGATYNSTTGAVTAPTYTVNGTDVNNVGAAISELDKGWNLASNGANAGAIKAGDTVDIGTAAGETNLQVAKSGNTIQYSLSRDLDLDSVTTGNSKLDNSGLTITGGPSITTAGIDAANTNISNVADATTADQAVNKGQLDAATAAADDKTDALGNSTASNLGGGATYNSTTGAVTAPTYTVNGTDVNNVGAAISELDKGWNLASNGANAGAIKAGDTVDIGTAAGETNLQVAKSGNTIQYSLSRDLDLDSVTTGNSKLDNSGLTITGGPSITTAGIDAANTNISNVADATTADQAVNKGQLDAATAAADDKTDALGNSTASNLGGGATYNSTTGAVTAPTYTVNGTDVNNVGAAISELDKGWNLASNGANAGAIKAGDTVDIGTAAGETNLQVAKSGNTIQYSLSRDLDLDSVTTGNSKLDNSGLTITGGPSITTAGIDAANTNISNVADATTADQAVNKGQLDAATAAADDKTDALGNSTASNLGGGATYNSTTGAVTAPTYTVNGTDVNNVGAAISELDKGWNLASNGANAGAIKAGDTVDIGTAAGETNLQVAKSGNTIQYSLSRDLDLDSVTTGNSKLDNSGLTITGGPSITTAGIDAANTNISNVADATTADQAVNKGQLDALASDLAASDNAAVKYDDAAVKDKVTLAGATGTTLTNVKAGDVSATSTDAVNGSQLFTTNQKVDQNTTNIATNTANIAKNTGDISTLNTTVTNQGNEITTLKGGFNLQTNGTNTGAIKAGDTVDIGVADPADTNLTATKTANNVAFALSKDLTLTSVTTGNTVINSAGLTADKLTVGNVVIDKATNKISGVEAGTDIKDVVNKGQLDALASDLAASDNAAVKYDDAAVKDKVTLAGATGTTLTNVKAGDVSATSTDAVNGSQLFTTNQKVDQNTTNIATNTANIAKNTGDISTLNTTVTNQGNEITTLKGGFNLQTNGTNAGAIKAGDTVDIGVADPADTNLTATKTGNNVAFALSKDLSLNSVNANQLAVGDVVVDKSTNTISGLSNKDLTAADFATQGRAATEEQLKQVISSNITEVVDGNGNKVNIIDQVVNTKPDNKNQDSLFLTYDKQGQETTDRLTIAQTVQKMNTEGVKFFHTNADTSKGDLGTTNDSSAGGLNSTAVGVNAIVETDAVSALAVGHNTKAGGAQSIAIGNGAEALGTQSISIGTGNKVTGDHSGAIGDPTIVDGSNSYSVGNNNQVLTDDTFVLGNNVTQTVTGSVVLGTGSAATTGAGVAGYALSTATTADKTAISNTTSTTGAVAIGDAANGIYRQITGVAAGSQDSDAVNVAQLKAVGNQVTTTQTSLVNSLGGNAKVNADGSITGPTYNVAQGTQTNVGDALTALDQAIGNAATTSKTTVSNGENIVVSKTKNADGSDNYQVSTAKDLTVDSIKAGETVLNNAGIAIANNAVVLNNTGLVIAGGPSVTTQGINAGNKQVTNVAAGTNATDAVNKGQLDSAINNVNNNVNQLANNAVKYDDATKDKITLGGANGTTISNVKDGTVAQGSKEAVNGGQLWNVQQQVNQNTSDIENIQTNINNINNGKSGLVQQQTPNGDITIGKDTGGTKVSVAGKDGDRVVTGVKDGVISATSKDAVNGSQLNVTNNKVVEFLGGGAGYDNITNSFTNPTYTVGGKEYNNVGGAVDALNKADQALDSKIDNVSNRLEQAFYSTNQRIDDVEKRANAGIAAAMALEAAPFVAGKYTYAAGASYHGGENAVGVTLRKTADNGRWSITGGVAAASQGDPSVRIGISGVID